MEKTQGRSANASYPLGIQRSQQDTLVSDWRALRKGKTGVSLSPNRLLASSFVGARDGSAQQTRHTTKMASTLPSWMWSLLSFAFGIRSDKPPNRVHVIVSTALRILTIVTALGFGVCGLVLNVYETINETTNATVLVCIFKSAVGALWILLGLYSRSLAARSFSNKALLDYVRLHSKTFMKVSTIALVTILSMASLGTNFYSNTYLLEDDSNATDKDIDVIDPTCASIALEVSACQVYFSFKVAFSFLNLVWILSVAGICLSVCRTHAICIRRFMKELSYDLKIFEEFSMLQISQQRTNAGEAQEKFKECDSYQDDILSSQEDDSCPPTNKKIWSSLHKSRKSGLFSQYGIEGKENSINRSGIESLNSNRFAQKAHVERKNENEENSQSEKVNIRDHGVDGQDVLLLPDLSTMKAPIMSNEDLYFTYFKLVRHLCTTSRLLQRWMTSSIIFVLMWCILLVIYWVSHPFELIDIFQFLVPLLVLGLLISAYAEVNYEGYMLIKYMVPTDDRMWVLHYVNTTPVALRVYSFILGYNILASFVAGIALSFASRIILYNI